MQEREKKRERMVARFAAKRAALKAVIADRNATDDERWDAQTALQKLPRDASPCAINVPVSAAPWMSATISVP